MEKQRRYSRFAKLINDAQVSAYVTVSSIAVSLNERDRAKEVLF